MSIHILSETDSIVKSVKRSSVKPEQISVSISNGNKKYIGNDETGFIIWSITEQVTCPFATRMCLKDCYAKKASKAYPTVKVSRRENLRAVYSPLFIERMVELILYKASTGKNKNRKRIVVRIHEAGDFFAEWYADAWMEIARRVSEVDSRIEFWTYTKSFVFFLGKKWCNAFRLRGSVWADTTPEQLERIAELQIPIYTAVEKFQDGDGYNHCECKDCATCETPCGDVSNGNTACEIH